MPHRAAFVTGLALLAVGLLYAVLPLDWPDGGSGLAEVLGPIVLIASGVAVLLRVGLLRRRAQPEEERA
jgi:hypothetical protein